MVAGQPRFLPTIVADKTSSNGVVSALLAALFARESTGKGQAVEVPMFETLVSFVMVEHLYGETFMPALDTAGYKRVLNKERRPYPSKDGYFALLPYTDGHWKEFCILVGREDLAQDARFQGMANRLKNVEQYYATLAGLCAERTNAEWVELLKNSNVPHGPVNTLDDLFVDPQLNATGYWQEVDHPSEGKLRMPGIAPRFSKTPPEITRLQPRLGEHSVEVLGEAGFTRAEIDAMLKSGATKDGVTHSDRVVARPTRPGRENDAHPSDAARGPALWAPPRRLLPAPAIAAGLAEQADQDRLQLSAGRADRHLRARLWRVHRAEDRPAGGGREQDRRRRARSAPSR